MKKYIAAFLCIAMCLALMSACGTETKPEESTEPITSEQPSEAPEDSAEPENPEDSSEPETSSPLADAITSARGDEENEAYPVQSDKDAIESMYYDVLGFTADDVTELAMSVSLINVKAYGIVIAKPAEGCEETVKAGLQGFIDTQCANFETYLADQYEIAKNAKLETLDDGTIIMVMCENADAVYEAIVAALAAGRGAPPLWRGGAFFCPAPAVQGGRTVV